MYGTWHGNPWGVGLATALTVGVIGGILLIIILVLKGYSLWYAARRGEKWWFIALLLINTVGILELIYLFAVAKVWGEHHVTGPTGPNDAPKS